MSVQQIIVFLVLSIASVYLIRQSYIAVKNFFAVRSGACGKCGFAKPDRSETALPPAIQRRNEIALQNSKLKR